MTRCKQCLTKAEPRDGLCPVCGIVQDKAGVELTPAEKKVRRHARGIRLVAMFHLVAAGTLAGMLPCNGYPAPMFILIAINLLLAFGLDRYSLLAYKAATVCYFLYGMVNVISIQRGAVHLGGIALMFLFLYLVGNGTSKAVFERGLPE